MIIKFVKKEEVLEKLNNLIFFNKNLEQVNTVENYLSETGGGLLRWMNAHEDFSFESQLIEKMKMVKSVVDEHGDKAIDQYHKLTQEPDKSHPFYDIVDFLKKDLPDIDKIFIPMKKEEFEFFLTIYNELKHENKNC